MKKKTPILHIGLAVNSNGYYSLTLCGYPAGQGEHTNTTDDIRFVMCVRCRELYADRLDAELAKWHTKSTL